MTYYRILHPSVAGALGPALAARLHKPYQSWPLQHDPKSCLLFGDDHATKQIDKEIKRER
jgi:hypothetical protein